MTHRPTDAQLANGYTQIPNSLSRTYSRLGLTGPEYLYVTQVMTFDRYTATNKQIAEYMGITERRAKQIRQGLLTRTYDGKYLVTASSKYDPAAKKYTETTFDLSYLFEAGLTIYSQDIQDRVQTDHKLHPAPRVKDTSPRTEDKPQTRVKDISTPTHSDPGGRILPRLKTIEVTNPYGVSHPIDYLRLVDRPKINDRIINDLLQTRVSSPRRGTPLIEYKPRQEDHQMITTDQPDQLDIPDQLPDDEETIPIEEPYQPEERPLPACVKRNHSLEDFLERATGKALTFTAFGKNYTAEEAMALIAYHSTKNTEDENLLRGTLTKIIQTVGTFQVRQGFEGIEMMTDLPGTYLDDEVLESLDKIKNRINLFVGHNLEDYAWTIAHRKQHEERRAS